MKTGRKLRQRKVFGRINFGKYESVLDFILEDWKPYDVEINDHSTIELHE